MRIYAFFLFIFLSSCSSYDKYKYLNADLEIPSTLFQASYQQTWSAVVGVMKKYDIELQNQETGVVKTKWMDNTKELNFSDAFGSSEKIKSARFKLFVNVNEANRGNKMLTKVTVYKRQLVEHDFLHGWKEIKQEHGLEKVLLYRVSRLIKIDNYLKKIQEEKEAKELQEAL